MTPLKQQFKHEPEKGVYGDCHRAAIASVLDLPLDEVPHFGDGLGTSEADGKEFERRERAFLLSRGLVPIRIAYESELDLVFRYQKAKHPGVYYLLGGSSRPGVNHTVVCLDDEIVHDPAGVGIRGPLDDGLYVVTFFGSAVACKEVA